MYGGYKIVNQNVIFLYIYPYYHILKSVPGLSLLYAVYIIHLILCYSLGAKRNVKLAGNYAKRIKLILID